MYKSLTAKGLGNLVAGFQYWLSSQLNTNNPDYDSLYAMTEIFTNGTQHGYCKYNLGGYAAQAIKTF